MEWRKLLTPDEGAWVCTVLLDQASSSFEESPAKSNNRTPGTHIYIVIRRAKTNSHVITAKERVRVMIMILINYELNGCVLKTIWK